MVPPGHNCLLLQRAACGESANMTPLPHVLPNSSLSRLSTRALLESFIQLTASIQLLGEILRALRYKLHIYKSYYLCVSLPLLPVSPSIILFSSHSLMIFCSFLSFFFLCVHWCFACLHFSVRVSDSLKLELQL